MQHKYLIFMIMLYMTIKLSAVVLIYKMISIGPFSVSASTLVLPLWFVLGDIIAEVYGYKIARHAIWIAILCQSVFAIICTLFISFHAPSDWSNQEAYYQMLGNLPRIVLANSLAIVSSAFLNAYIIAKWKILFCGKYFWLRSMGASTIGELIFTIFACFIQFLGMIPLSKLLCLMITSYAIKLVLNPILAIPSTLITYLLKQSEGIDPYHYMTEFNPFRDKI